MYQRASSPSRALRKTPPMPATNYKMPIRCCVPRMAAWSRNSATTLRHVGRLHTFDGAQGTGLPAARDCARLQIPKDIFCAGHLRNTWCAADTAPCASTLGRYSRRRLLRVQSSSRPVLVPSSWATRPSNTCRSRGRFRVALDPTLSPTRRCGVSMVQCVLPSCSD